jgi:hypothetical protein
MELLGDLGHLESYFGLFRDNVSVGARSVHGLRQCIMGLEIILDAPDGTPGDEAQVETRFGSFGNSANLDAR